MGIGYEFGARNALKKDRNAQDIGVKTSPSNGP